MGIAGALAFPLFFYQVNYIDNRRWEAWVCQIETRITRLYLCGNRLVRLPPSSQVEKLAEENEALIATFQQQLAQHPRPRPLSGPAAARRDT